MSKLTVEIETDNAAFEGTACAGEVARILRKLAKRIEDTEFLDGHKIPDINGNMVCRSSFED